MSIDYTELPKNKKRKNEEYNYIILNSATLLQI